MSMQPPKIDPRTSEVIVDRVKMLVQRYTALAACFSCRPGRCG